MCIRQQRSVMKEFVEIAHIEEEMWVPYFTDISKIGRTGNTGNSKPN